MSKADVNVDDLKFRFERRRYAGCTYTWAWVCDPEGKWISLGDPWPCFTPKHSELVASARHVLGIEPKPSLRDMGYRL